MSLQLEKTRRLLAEESVLRERIIVWKMSVHVIVQSRYPAIAEKPAPQ